MPLGLSDSLLAAGPVPLPLHSGLHALPPSRRAGLRCWPLQPRVPLQPAFFPFHCPHRDGFGTGRHRDNVEVAQESNQAVVGRERGLVAWSNLSAPSLASALEIKRRNISLVAMPRTPPSALHKAVRRAITSALDTSAGTRACARSVEASAVQASHFLAKATRSAALQ